MRRLIASFVILFFLVSASPALPQAVINGQINIVGSNGLPQSLPVKWAAINATGLGDNTVITAVTGKKLRIVVMWFRGGTLAVSVSFKSGPNIKVEPMLIAANESFSVNGLPNAWVVETNSGEAFVINLSLAVDLRGAVSYVEVP